MKLSLTPRLRLSARSPSHSNIATVGSTECHAPLGPPRLVTGTPVNRPASCPPTTVAPANTITLIVISDGTNLVVSSVLRLAVPSAIGRASLNPMPTRATVLSRTRRSSRNREGLQSCKASYCHLSNLHQRIQHHCHTMTRIRLDVSRLLHSFLERPAYKTKMVSKQSTAIAKQMQKQIMIMDEPAAINNTSMKGHNDVGSHCGSFDPKSSLKAQACTHKTTRSQRKHAVKAMQNSQQSRLSLPQKLA